MLGLAAIARELGLNDAQVAPEAKAGGAADRNVELVLAAPFIDPLAPPTTTLVPATPVPVPVPASPIPGTSDYTG